MVLICWGDSGQTDLVFKWDALDESLTWHYGNRLEGPENPEGSESGQVAELNEGSEVACRMEMVRLSLKSWNSHDPEKSKLHVQLYNIHAWEYDNEIQPVPGVSKVGVVVQDETLGDDFDHHFHRVDGQEDNSAIVKLVSVKLFLQISQMWQLP